MKYVYETRKESPDSETCAKKYVYETCKLDADVYESPDSDFEILSRKQKNALQMKHKYKRIKRRKKDKHRNSDTRHNSKKEDVKCKYPHMSSGERLRRERTRKRILKQNMSGEII